EHLFLLRKKYRRVIGDLGMTGNGPVATEPPSTEQIAREIGISPRKLTRSNLAMIERVPQPRIDQDGEAVSPIESVADSHRPEDEVLNHEERVLLETALRRLNPFEAWVIRERYGLFALIPDENGWADPSPRVARPVADHRTLATRPNQPGRRRTCFQRPYTE